MKKFDPHIVCCYLFPISKYGYPPPAGDTPAHIAEMAALGFRSVELEGIRAAHLQQVYDLRTEIRQCLDAQQAGVPYFCAVLPGLSAADEAERERALALFEKGCELARFFGARGVLDNGPLPPYRFPGEVPVARHFDPTVLRHGTFPADLKWSPYWQALVETYRAACDIAATFGLSYQLHPCQGALTATTEGFLLFREAVQRDNLRFNFDTANLFFMRENLPLSLRRAADAIDYIHLSDNPGDRVAHLPPGQGEIAWDPFFETLEFIGFRGHIGLDIGGAESGVEDLERVYRAAAEWVGQRYMGHDS